MIKIEINGKLFELPEEFARELALKLNAYFAVQNRVNNLKELKTIDG